MLFQLGYGIIIPKLLRYGKEGNRMSDSICNFVPPKRYGEWRTVHFVYETDFHELAQPFLHPIYYLFLVTSGEATVHSGDGSFSVERGCAYLLPPAVFYTVEASEDFRYMYVSFTGEGAAACLKPLHAEQPFVLRRNLTELIDFWFSAIVRVNGENANFLSESVLFYTLSYFLPAERNASFDNVEALSHMLVDYIGNHFTEPDLSLGKIASAFCYTEKYLSTVFKKHMKVGFSQYLGSLRLAYAKGLLSHGVLSVSEVAVASGYRDALYFSKVFKARYGMPPGELARKENRENLVFKKEES